MSTVNPFKSPNKSESDIASALRSGFSLDPDSIQERQDTTEVLRAELRLQLASNSGRIPCVDLMDGGAVYGEPAFFSLEDKMLGVAENGGSFRRIAFGAMSVFCFSSAQASDLGILPAQWRGAPVLLAEPQTFKAHLSNQTEFATPMRAYLRDASGAYLVIPPVGANDYDRFIFIPEQNIVSVVVGEPLGAQLVKNGVLSSEQVSVALALQKTLRLKPLGKYLRNGALIDQQQLVAALALQKESPCGYSIGDILLAQGLITRAQLDQVLASQTLDRKKPLGQFLIEQGFVTPKELNKLLAQKQGIPEVSISRFPVERRAVQLIPERLARKSRAVPLFFNAGSLVAALENPLDQGVLKELAVFAQCRIDAVLASTEEISQGIETHYGDPKAAGAEQAQQSELPGVVATAKAAMAADAVSDADGVLVRMVNEIIAEGHRQGASDIHLEPRPGGIYKVRFRKDGVLENHIDVPSDFRQALVSRIKIMANLDISEKRRPQVGRIDFSKFSSHAVSLRVSAIPTSDGVESITLRILTQAKPIPLDRLGMEKDTLAELRALIAKPHGLILVSGPTGSGKTTTLHSALAALNTPERKIWTAEDPIEIVQEGLNQVQINTKIAWTFAAALSNFLRADPDVVMIGEIRDHETAAIAISAALSGHLLFSTVHTNSACESVSRLVEIGLDAFSFADALRGVLAQRLVRALCESCKTPSVLSIEESDLLAQDYLGDDDPAAIRTLLDDWKLRYGNAGGGLTTHAAGACKHCSKKGFRGRIGIHELLTVTPQIRRLTQRRASQDEILAAARNDGLRTLRQDGILKVLQGRTTIEEMRSACS